MLSSSSAPQFRTLAQPYMDILPRNRAAESPALNGLEVIFCTKSLSTLKISVYDNVVFVVARTRSHLPSSRRATEMAREPAWGSMLENEERLIDSFFEGYKVAERAARVEGGRRFRKLVAPPADRGEVEGVYTHVAPDTVVTCPS